MRLSVADAPTPMFRGIGAYIAQSQRAVFVACHTLDKFGREPLHNDFANAEREQARRGESDLIRVFDRRSFAIDVLFHAVEIVEIGRSETTQPPARGMRLDNAQQHIPRALERVEGGFGDRLDVAFVDLRSRHCFRFRLHISVSQRRISSSLMIAFSKPLRMRLLRARSRAVNPGYALYQ